MALISFKSGDTASLTKNFNRNEFQCPCGCSQQVIDEGLVNKLQIIRTGYGVPIKITSGYRCKTHNKAVGGSNSSRHMSGIAADWREKDKKINPVALGILAAPIFPAVGIYWYGSTAFVHTDVRASKATWLCTESGKYAYTSDKSFILPTIKRGSTGTAETSAVKMLQRLLGLTPDGVFGAATETAVKAAQRQHGLTADGIVGEKSWTAISGAAEFMK